MTPTAEHPGGASAEEFHRLMKTDDQLWSTATPIGFQSDGDHDVLELRDCCICHSCVARIVPPTTIYERVEREMREIAEADDDEDGGPGDDEPTDPGTAPLLHRPRHDPPTQPEIPVSMSELMLLPVEGRKG